MIPTPYDTNRCMLKEEMYQSKIVNEAIAQDADQALEEWVAEENSIIIFCKEWLVQEGKWHHRIDVQHHHTQDGHPQQRNACG